MEYKILPTEAEVKLGIDDLQPNELDIAFERGFSDAKLEDINLYEALKGILLVAIPIGDAEFEFEKKYVGKFEVRGNRLETALQALAKAEADRIK